MLKCSKEKTRQHARTDRLHKQRGGNSKEELSRNARDQELCNKNEEYLCQAHQQTGQSEKRIFELKDISVEIPKTEKQREKRLKKIKI